MVIEVLPIDAVLPAIGAAVRAPGAVVVVAPPGAGKTTRVPPALLAAGLAGEQQIVMLQPRRVAARLAAHRIADEQGWKLGGRVGYQIRFERRISAATRIEILTEGLLTRRLQNDPFLDGVGCVILDEFHERSLHADLCLALLREVRRSARQDLKLVVMSATLDPGPVAAFLECPVVASEGRIYPVEISYDPRPATGPVHARVAAAVKASLTAEGAGHVLVFLPGVGEIKRSQESLGGLTDVDVLPLHGQLASEAQDRALRPTSRPKVVLATNIAETSVTLAGVTTVVDSGLARVPRFDPVVGLTRLEQVGISKASADQRAGRAGRTAAGRCRRLWTEAEQLQRPASHVAEIRRADLCPVILELLVWGVDPSLFEWFEAPPVGAIEAAESLLRRLGALEETGGVSSLGRTLSRLPVHPRLARVVVDGHARGVLRLAAGAAALVSERDFLREPLGYAGDSDLWPRLELLERADAGQKLPPGVHRSGLSAVRKVRDQLIALVKRELGVAPTSPPSPEAEARALIDSLLAGFPDRVGLRRGPRSDRFRLVGGHGAILDEHSVVKEAPLILAVALRGARRGERSEHRIQIATTLERAWLPIEEVDEVRFDAQLQAVTWRRLRRYRDLVLGSRTLRAGDDADAEARALAEAAKQDPEAALSWSPKASQLRARLGCLAEWAPELGFPRFEELGALIDALCAGRRSFAQLQKADLHKALMERLSWPQRQALDRLAPPRMAIPTGREVTLHYEPGRPPVLAARIQQLFGLLDTPRVADGRVPVTLHLLAPNNRPAQVTQDLKSFWSNTYPEVRKELRGRYPKHDWPEDPTTATPRDGALRRRRERS